jgi:hypothetical protein
MQYTRNNAAASTEKPRSILDLKLLARKHPLRHLYLKLLPGGCLYSDHLPNHHSLGYRDHQHLWLLLFHDILLLNHRLTHHHDWLRWVLFDDVDDCRVATTTALHGRGQFLLGYQFVPFLATTKLHFVIDATHATGQSRANARNFFGAGQRTT